MIYIFVALLTHAMLALNSILFFFFGSTSLDRILTTDNLQKRLIICAKGVVNGFWFVWYSLGFAGDEDRGGFEVVGWR